MLESIRNISFGNLVTHHRVNTAGLDAGQLVCVITAADGHTGMLSVIPVHKQPGQALAIISVIDVWHQIKEKKSHFKMHYRIQGQMAVLQLPYQSG